MDRSDEQLRTILNASPVPLIISRVSDGIILYANEHLAALVGLSPEEVIGRATMDFYRDPQERALVLDRLRKDGYIRDHELRIKREDGQVVWVMLSLVTTEFGGEPVVVGGLYDITEHRQADEALRESEALFRQLTENINEVFWMTDQETGRILFISPAYDRIYGRSREHLYEGQSYLQESIHPDDLERVQARISASRIRPITEYDEFRIVRPDGTVRWIRTRAFPVRNSAGEVYRMCGVDEDFTERKQIAESLESERNFVSAILDTAGALVVVLDPQGQIVRFNRACERITGYAFEEVRGKVFWDVFVMPEEMASVKDVFEDLRTGHFPNACENHWVTRDGERRLISWSNTAILDNAGAVEYIIGTGIDVTEHRQAQAQLVQSEKMASLGNLVAGIAHEINTPVGAIYSMHDTLIRAVGKLERTLETEFPQEYRDNRALQSALKVISDANRVIATGTTRVTEIVSSLRSFARLDEAEMKEADLHEGIDNALTLVYHTLKNRIDVVKHYGNIPPIVCYPSRLNQVFLNILVNAAQAIEDTGEITIATFVKGDRVHVAIQDTGVGISEAHLKEIFDPGFTTKGVKIGTGLGLSICYQIIQDHRGEIRVESSVGEGTTFTVILPTDLSETSP